LTIADPCKYSFSQSKESELVDQEPDMSKSSACTLAQDTGGFSLDVQCRACAFQQFPIHYFSLEHLDVPKLEQHGPKKSYGERSLASEHLSEKLFSCQTGRDIRRDQVHLYMVLYNQVTRSIDYLAVAKSIVDGNIRFSSHEFPTTDSDL
jgi:hypothetical protein